MLPSPDVTPSAAWYEVWTGYELHLLALGRSQNSIKNSRYVVLVMARHATADHVEPPQVSKPWLQRYLIKQFEDRTGLGSRTLYQYVRAFWAWYAGEYQVPGPMTGIPRPKGEARQMPVLDPGSLGTILKSCRGNTDAEAARNTALIWMLLESGLRRFELCALDWDDLDLRARTVVVRRGKGGRARVAVFGDSTASALWKWRRLAPGGAQAVFTSCQSCKRGDRLTTGGLNQVLRRIGNRAGVKLGPHMFRHSWTHFSLEGGMREGDLMKLAGWQSSKMISYYGSALAQERAIAAGKLVQVGNVIRGR